MVYGIARGEKQGDMGTWGQIPILLPQTRVSILQKSQMRNPIALSRTGARHGSTDLNASHPGRRRHQGTGDGGADDDGVVGVGCGTHSELFGS